ncbi:acyl transferase [Aspergillus steynii IBT 23096]|uniref:Acyl transferase n=1 Tax=Aspergillus steynii IBT 23096 TaxID=1392250 RepID=A0A2I2G157_9EURO|nr:acyl transferase [Aspergillus steynii IBT 23096]PLB46611.1 acyl transferase [Aspergillus steynii IBT 23096]
MVNKDLYDLYPHGWETSPPEERFKVSTLDYLTGLCYTHFAVYFRLEDADKSKAAAVLKESLQRTLAQIGHLCGTIEKDPEGGHSFVKKRQSTVQLIIQWLDSPEDTEKFPSMSDMEASSFAGLTLGDFKNWSIEPMTYGERPEAHPDKSPTASAFIANFVRGGLVLVTHMHHYANDVMGWAGFIHQLAENCYAIHHKTPFPAWDPACNDVSIVSKLDPPSDQRVNGPPEPQRHPDQKPGQCLLFHLPKSKAAELKALAAPEDGTWISTYDAFAAFLWRTVTRLRQPVFQTSLESPIFWCEAVDMRRRLNDPPVHPRIQHNVLWAALSDQAPFRQLTHGEVISQKPLSELAAYIRRITNTQTQANLDTALTAVSHVKDKTNLNIRINSKPPMSIIMTDHREAKVTDADFGFARPLAHRHLQRGDGVTVGVCLVYPPRLDEDSGSDEGNVFALMYEKELAGELIADEEFRRYFEYRGVDSE